MRPNFALNLSHEGLSLLRRATGGWRVLGEVALDDAELAQKLGYLRRTATDLSSGQFACKLVIPDSQILYRKFKAPGADDQLREAAIRDALDGATPYAVDDLVYDWRDAGADQAWVAAVARETLEEAEGFATEHRFNPVSFVAMPGAEWRGSEPFFGACRLAETLLPEGEVLEPDAQMMVVLAHGELAHDEVADGAPSEERDEAPDQATEPAAIAADSPQTVKPVRVLPKAKTKARKARKAARAAREAGKLADQPAAAAAFSTRRAGDAGSDAGPGAGVASRLDRLEGRIVLGADARSTSHPDVPRLNGARRSPEISEMAVTAPTLAGEEKVKAHKPAAAPVAAPVPAPAPPSAPVAAKKPQNDVPKPAAAMRAARGEPPPAQTEPGRAEAEAMTVFGARDAAARRSRLKYPGLGLVALLLVAALVTGFLPGARDSVAQLWRGVTSPGVLSETEGEIATTPVAPASVTERIVQPEIRPAGPAVGTDIAALSPPRILGDDPRFLTEEEAAEAGPDLGSPETLTLQEANDAYLGTGIWPFAPLSPAVPRGDRVDDLYIASIDRAVLVVDAVALPPAAAGFPDTGLRAMRSPAAAGTKLDLDERGLVQALPEGAVTPDGVTIFAGRPARLPVLRPGTVAPAPAPAAAATPAPISNEILAARRPVARPAGLIEQDERARLGGMSRAELAARRPVARPASPQDAGSAADQAPTALAVLSSRRPVQRSGEFAQVVASIRAKTEAAAAEQAAVAAAAAAVASAPQASTAAPTPRDELVIPTTAVVAREATVVNAISLSRINLIGVYGSDSSRRALVRLKSGRYVKVEVGDRLDGGRVASISADLLRYQKNGRMLTLALPKG